MDILSGNKTTARKRWKWDSAPHQKPLPAEAISDLACITSAQKGFWNTAGTQYICWWLMNRINKLKLIQSSNSTEQPLEIKAFVQNREKQQKRILVAISHSLSFLIFFPLDIFSIVFPHLSLFLSFPLLWSLPSLLLYVIVQQAFVFTCDGWTWMCDIKIPLNGYRKIYLFLTDEHLISISYSPTTVYQSIYLLLSWLLEF